MPLLTHTTPAPKRVALSCEFTKDQKAAEERLASAKMYEDVDLRGIPLLEFPASLLEQPTGAGVAQFDAATLGSMLAADRDAALRGELRSYLSQQKDARHKALASMTAMDVDELVEGVQAACSSKKGAELAMRVRNVASGHARFDGDESDGDSFRRSSEVQEQKLGGGGRSSFFRRSSEVREVGR